MEPHKPIAGTITSWDKVNYLTSLLKLMITEDLTRQEQPTVEAEETGLVRRLPVIAPQFANPLSLRLKRTQETDIAQKMAPTDNPWLTSLQAAWVGKILYDGGYFRIVQVQYVPNQGNNRYPCWEATSEPVYYNNGQYVVHDRHCPPRGFVAILSFQSKTHQRTWTFDIKVDKLPTYYMCRFLHLRHW